MSDENEVVKPEEETVEAPVETTPEATEGEEVKPAE